MYYVLDWAMGSGYLSFYLRVEGVSWVLFFSISVFSCSFGVSPSWVFCFVVLFCLFLGIARFYLLGFLYATLCLMYFAVNLVFLTLLYLFTLLLICIPVLVLSFIGRTCVCFLLFVSTYKLVPSPMTSYSTVLVICCK